MPRLSVAGRRHRAAGGLSSASPGRTARNNTSPSAVITGADSPFTPWVSLRAGTVPVGSNSHMALRNSVRLSFSALIVVTTRDPSGDTASPDTRGTAR